MEELSKKLADHDQASKVQQQKLKVGQLGDGPALCWPQVERGGKVLSPWVGAPWGLAASGALPVPLGALEGRLEWPPTPRPSLSATVATNHVWLFKLK